MRSTKQSGQPEGKPKVSQENRYTSCPECGAALSSRQRTCSDACRQKAYRKRNSVEVQRIPRSIFLSRAERVVNIAMDIQLPTPLPEEEREWAEMTVTQGNPVRAQRRSKIRVNSRPQIESARTRYLQSQALRELARVEEWKRQTEEVRC